MGQITLQGVQKSFGPVHIIKGADLDIADGSFVVFVGPSGCGKTTLLRLIAGLEQATEGRIVIGDRDVTLLPAGERNVSMVFQSYALFPHMSVLDNVAYGLVSSGLRRREAHARADAALETVGLKGFGARLPSEMSGGQQQRVAVARALVLEPDVLLFDEPLSNLDARLRRSMRQEIRALQQRLNLTVVYVTHDQSEALAVSDKIVVMRNAEIAQVGTPEQLYTQPNSVFVATFMGEANHVIGRIEALDGDAARVTVGGLALRLPHRGLQPGRVDLVIRPEAIKVVPPSPAPGIPGTVTRTTYMGSHAEYQVTTDVGELFVVSPDRLARRALGEAVHVSLDPDGVVVVRP